MGLHPPAPRLPRHPHQDPVSGLQLRIQHHRPSSSPGQAILAERTWAHLQVDHWLPDRQEAARAAGQACLRAADHHHWGATRLCGASSSPSTQNAAPLASLLSNSWFADDTTLIGLILNGDESILHNGPPSFQVQPEHLGEMIADFRRSLAPTTPLIMCEFPVNAVESFRFLGTIISGGWGTSPPPLRRPSRGWPSLIPSSAHRSVSGSLPPLPRTKTNCSRSFSQLRKVIGCNMPSLLDPYSRKRAWKIIANKTNTNKILILKNTETDKTEYMWINSNNVNQ